MGANVTVLRFRCPDSEPPSVAAVAASIVDDWSLLNGINHWKKDWHGGCSAGMRNVSVSGFCDGKWMSL